MERKTMLLILAAVTAISVLTACSVSGPEDQAQKYVDEEGWSFSYPGNWDKVQDGFVQESTTGKTVVFNSQPVTQAELEAWIQSEIERKVNAREADNELEVPLEVSRDDKLSVYTYTIRSRGDGSEALLRNTIFFDGNKMYEFRTSIPPVTEDEFNTIVNSFRTE